MKSVLAADDAGKMSFWESRIPFHSAYDDVAMQAVVDSISFGK
jgi:hypothetical protein